MAILVPNLQITRSDIRPHIKWVVCLVIVYSHFNLPWRIAWACMSPHTHFIALPPPTPPPPRAQVTHLMKHTSNYFFKCACVLQNIHSSSAHDGNKGLQFILSLQYSCKKRVLHALHTMFSSYQRPNKCPAIMSSFLFKLHHFKHRWHIWLITHHITFVNVPAYFRTSIPH